MDLVRFENVSFSYQTQAARVDILVDFDLSASSGEYLAIVGPSGSGKSTLLNLAAGFISPKSGSVSMSGEEVPTSGRRADIYRNKTIGYVFQSFNLLSTMTALENVMVPLLISGAPKSETKRKALEQLDALGLVKRADHLPNQLSGGEQQRVAIARAIVNEAELILADEPTGNLDLESSEMIARLLCDIHSQGKTIVLVTHDHTLAASADRVFELPKL